MAIRTCSKCKAKYSDPNMFKSRKTKGFLKTCRKCRGDLTPPSFRAQYFNYLNSPEWKKKKEAYVNSGRKLDCYICHKPAGSFARDLHHRTYERFGREHLDDLVPICRPCHKKVSEAWIREKRKPRLSRRTLWRLTEDMRKKVSR